MNTSRTQHELDADTIAEMRGWIADCYWGDMDERDIDELTDAQVLRGVARHFCGGVDAFVRGMA